MNTELNVSDATIFADSHYCEFIYRFLKSNFNIYYKVIKREGYKINDMLFLDPPKILRLSVFRTTLFYISRIDYNKSINDIDRFKFSPYFESYDEAENKRLEWAELDYMELRLKPKIIMALKSSFDSLLGGFLDEY